MRDGREIGERWVRDEVWWCGRGKGGVDGAKLRDGREMEEKCARDRHERFKSVQGAEGRRDGGSEGWRGGGL